MCTGIKEDGVLREVRLLSCSVLVQSTDSISTIGFIYKLLPNCNKHEDSAKSLNTDD